MIELSREQYHHVQGLLDFEGCYLEPKSVADHNTPGWIFVDQTEEPETAMIWSMGNHGFYFAGERISGRFREGFPELLRLTLLPRLRQRGLGDFEYSSAGKDIDEALEALFRPFSPTGWPQWGFRYEGKGDLPVPRGIATVPVCDLIGKPYGNMDFLIRHIEDYWGDMGAFLALGLGYCVIDEGIIAALCHSGCATGNRHAIHIETAEAYRRRGYGEAAAACLVNAYVERGILPYWECYGGNEASAALATKLGFTRIYEYTCYDFPLDKLNGGDL